MMKALYCSIYIVALILLGACSNIGECGKEVEKGHIYPDYANTTLPCNISPISFYIGGGDVQEMRAVFSASDVKKTIYADNGEVAIESGDWRELLESADSISVSIEDEKETVVNRFVIFISRDSIDSHIAYRLIEPGYEVWNEMGIYQRDLETGEEKAILKNSQTGYGCMNCHSFCQRDPGKMLFHMRKICNGTYIVNGNEIEKLNTKTPHTISALVYPSWHPSGRYVAFSTNITKQMFHTSDRNRIEVYDMESDVVVYDTKTHKIVSCPQLKSEAAFETFPAFSADGKTLYFCSADSVTMSQQYEKVKYSLCSIAFDEKECSFGSRVDTLFSGRSSGKSVSFPRVSPDGRWMMFTLSDYGNFSIWHKEADLYMMDLDNDVKEAVRLVGANSDDVESYHSWSSNSRWVVFSSRRLDGLYTRPFISHIDENGKASKPFVVPQRDAFYYDRLMKSFNIPEFITGEVIVSGYDLSDVARNDQGVDVVYK